MNPKLQICHQYTHIYTHIPCSRLSRVCIYL